jgi:rhodanese-related sulfurtransferase
MLSHRSLIIGLAGFSLVLASCGGAEPAADAARPTPGSSEVAGDDATDDAAADAALGISGLSTISAVDAAAIADAPPADLVVLDIRTPEEFAEGHLEGAVLVDFYDADFADQLAALDPDVPYLLYCRSGNRSGQALGVMEQLGFTSVANVDGGIIAWTGAGLPVAGG